MVFLGLVHLSSLWCLWSGLLFCVGIVVCLLSAVGCATAFACCFAPCTPPPPNAFVVSLVVPRRNASPSL